MTLATGGNAAWCESRGRRAPVAVILGLSWMLVPGLSAGAEQPEAAPQPEPGVVERLPAPQARAASEEPGLTLALPAPEPSEAIRAFNLVRAWVDAWEVGSAGSAPRCAAACVTLRLDGRVVARSQATAAPDSGGQGVVEEAVRQALVEAEGRMVVVRDALMGERLREQGSRMVVSVELAGVAVPVDVASFEEAALVVSPGVTGVGARLGAGQGAPMTLIFPSRMVISDLDSGSALASAAGEVLGDASATLSSAAALSERGVRFLTFESVWVTQVGEDGSAAILQRGGRVFENRDVTTPMIRELGAKLADVVAASVDESGPFADLADVVPEAAASMERALRAYALARWAGTPGAGTPEQVEAWTRRAGDLLAEAGGSMGRASPGAAALWVMAGAALPDGEVAEPVLDPPPTRTSLAVARGLAGEALGRALLEHESSPAPVAAMLAWAGASRGVRTGNLAMVDMAEAALRSAYARTPAGEWVGLMPWAGWAEIVVAQAPTADGGRRGDMPGAAALRDVREMVWRHQINASDVSAGDRDLVGGIVFTRGRQALPTWHSLRPVAMAATMVGHESLTAENEFPGQVLRMLSAVRFLRQLCADEAVMTWGEGPAWGVRASTWSDEQPAEASAMGLVVLTEMVRSLEAVMERREAMRRNPGER